MKPAPDDAPSPRHGEYVAWLHDTLGLTPADNPGDLLALARREFGAQLESWVDRFYEEED
ncbi:hypothetical protein SBI_07576 [Streptomyces bingchenggensis BCW-1]|uniref:Uncharacterized protein n=1 Tax=Streptomyces bingchenggensis (strain BCW-1) TaxID=749414 RepID=D7CB13_STRBB|nr:MULTISPECIES: hypothetical protein [Streptomyces]ADI10696.1 hypothetical protein SBI_07576 [Streptomyces bingchenggensis BCW-1]